MKVYIWIRDWVDRRLRGSNARGVALPLPVIGLGWILFDLPMFGFSAFFGAWTAFVAWRWWVYMKEEAIRGDREYDRHGKFCLAREYWGTESATAAAERRKNDD